MDFGSHANRLPPGHAQRLPGVVALEHRRVAVPEQLRLERRGHLVADLRRGGPDVAQVDRLSVLAGAERLAGEIDVHPAGERERDDQHRGGEIVGPHGGVYPGLEVPVAAQHRRRHKVMLVHQLPDDLGQRAAVADAGGAAVARRSGIGVHRGTGSAPNRRGSRSLPASRAPDWS